MTMHCVSLMFFLTLLLQQTIHVQSSLIPTSSNSDETLELNPGRHLQVLRVDRSLSFLKPTNIDHANFNNHKLDSSQDNHKEFITLGKRRNGVPLYGRRGSPEKRRVPLYG